MSSFRVAIVGFGLAGEFFHAPFVAALDGLELAAVVTRNEERRAGAREKYPDVELLDTPEAIWAEPGRFDLVVVASPNDTHAPLAIAALEHGLNVVVDKPMASTPDAARSMIDAAESAGKMLTVFQNRRWDYDFLTVRALAEAGEFGARIERFESRFERFRPQLKEGAWRELADPDVAGGVLFDLGPHLIDQAVVLLGEPVSVYAEIDTRRPEAQVDDDVFIALDHGDGVRSHLYASQTAAIDGGRMRVSGLGGAVEFADLDPQEDALRAGAGPGDAGFGDGPAARFVGAESEREIATAPGNYLAFYEGVRDALRGDAPPPVDPRDSLRVLEIIAAARRSVDEKAVITL
jgi:predicted dehydrogenase